MYHTPKKTVILIHIKRKCKLKSQKKKGKAHRIFQIE
jgi:hypothetical protein